MYSAFNLRKKFYVTHGLHGGRPLLGGVGNLRANLLGQIENPGNGLTRILRPQLYLSAVTAELVLFQQRGHHCGNARGVGAIEQNARGGVALGNCGCLFLDKSAGKETPAE